MNKFFKAVAFVTIFSVLTRALGFFLRIYLSRVMGAETLGAYQISMSIFGVLMTLIASGLPLVISRNVAYYNAKGDKVTQHKSITAGLIVSLVVSVAITAFIMLFPNVLKVFIKSDESVKIIQALSPALIASAIYAILRGGLWGQKYFFTISFTEFFEQLARIVFCIVLFSVPMGLSVGQKAAWSLTLSCVASAVLVFVLYFAFGGKFCSPKGEFKTIIKTSTPITLVRTISSIVGSLVAIIIPVVLTNYGYTESEALAQFGIFMGMTMPLVMVPSTFISSIAVALVPEISSYTKNIDKEQVKNIGELSKQVLTAIKTTVLISFALMPVFIALGTPICTILFNNAEAGKYLTVGAILMLPMGVGQICSSMLNALGLEMKALMNYAIGAIGLFLCIFLLPRYIGTYSIAVGMLVMHTTTCVLSLSMLKKRKVVDLSFIKIIGACAIICVPTAILGYLVYSLLIKFIPMFFAVAIGCIITFVFNILLMFVLDLANIKIVVAQFISKRKHKKNLSAQPA